MRFNDEAWRLYRKRLHLPDTDRTRLEAEVTADLEALREQAGGDEEKALGLLALELVQDIGRRFQLDEAQVLKQLRHLAPRRGRDRLKKALRRARGGAEEEQPGRGNS